MNDFIQHLLGGFSFYGADRSVWIVVLDLLFVYYLLYRTLLLLKGTKAVSMFLGLLLLLVVYFAAQFFGLQTFSWLLGGFFNSFILVVLILFQEDLRRALAQVGINPFGRSSIGESDLAALEEIKRSVTDLSNKDIGALIVLQREADVMQHIQGGVELDATPSAELLFSVFIPYSPIHDGAVLIQNGRVSRAGCFLPLTQRLDISKHLGTRHRAAIGMSELTDALVVVVSETDGQISLCVDGEIRRGLDPSALYNELLTILSPNRTRHDLMEIEVEKQGD